MTLVFWQTSDDIFFVLFNVFFSIFQVFKQFILIVVNQTLIIYSNNWLSIVVDSARRRTHNKSAAAEDSWL